MIARSINEKNLTIALVASMQSGKSKTAYALFNYILPDLGLIKQNESGVDFLNNLAAITSSKITD